MPTPTRALRPSAVIHQSSSPSPHVAPDGRTAAVWQQQALGNPPGWLMRDRPEPWQPVAAAAELNVGAEPAAEQQGRVRRKDDTWVKYREQTGFIVVRHRPDHEPDEFIVTMGEACVNSGAAATASSPPAPTSTAPSAACTPATTASSSPSTTAASSGSTRRRCSDSLPTNVQRDMYK